MNSTTTALNDTTGTSKMSNANQDSESETTASSSCSNGNEKGVMRSTTSSNSVLLTSTPTTPTSSDVVNQVEEGSEITLKSSLNDDMTSSNNTSCQPPSSVQQRTGATISSSQHVKERDAQTASSATVSIVQKSLPQATTISSSSVTIATAASATIHNKPFVLKHGFSMQNVRAPPQAPTIASMPSSTLVATATALPSTTSNTTTQTRPRSNSVPFNFPSNTTSSTHHHHHPTTSQEQRQPKSSSSSSPTTSNQKSNQQLRRGKWTVEEETYVARVIQDFNTGYLNAPPGTTLRSYLSDKLNCDPMRITKKFTGDACIGKRVFHPAVRCANNASLIDKAQVSDFF